MDRIYLTLPLSLLPWLFGYSQSLYTGSWTVQQVVLRFSESTFLQLNTQPRFIPLWPSSADMLVVNAFFGWQGRAHGVAGGGNHAWIWLPRPFTQWRALIRWQWRISPHWQTQLSLENRWQNGSSIERLIRPQGRYRLPVGPFWVGLQDELLLYGWNSLRGWHLAPRQNRFWAFFAYPRGRDWEVEVGYLHLAAPRSIPRHRAWIAVRWTLSFRRPPPRETGKADPATEAQTPPPESPAGSLQP